MNETNRFDKKASISAIVMLIVGLTALIGNLALFVSSYPSLLKGYKEAHNLAGVKLIAWVFPAMSDLIMIAGIALLVASVGYFTKKPWAFLVSLIAVILGLLGTWMALVWPLMISYPPIYAPVFLTFFATWFVLLVYIKRINVKILILATLAGITMVLNFMNGVATLNKLLGSIMQFGAPAPLFVVSQQLNWIAAIAWGVFCVGIIYRHRWALIMGLGGGLLPLLSGTPLAYTHTIQSGGFSLFWLAPALSFILLLLLLVKGEKLWMFEETSVVTVQQGVNLPG